MGHLLSILFQSVRRNLTLFVAILLVLASGNWIRGEWKTIQGIVDELPALRSAHEAVGAYRAEMTQGVVRQVRQLSGAATQRLDTRIRTLDDEIRQLQLDQDKVSFVSAAVAGGDAVPAVLAQTARRNIDIELRRQERAYLLALRARVDAMVNRQAAFDKLEQIRLAHVTVYTALQAALKQRAAIQANAGLRASIFFTEPYRQVQALERQIQTLRIANDGAHKAYLAQRALLDQLPTLPARADFRIDEQRLAAIAAPLRERIVRAEALAARNVVWQAWQAVQPLLPAALGVLLGWWLVPAAIRALFYFVLAPLAARRPPVVFAAPERGAPASAPAEPHAGRDGARISAVSHKVALAPGHDMLVRPDFCQSQPTGVRITTKVLFDWHYWLTSIAAHLWMLNRIRNIERTAGPAEIVVSSTVDALDEVALLHIQPGEAFVLQPRGLVGMVYETGRRPRIRSHWRLGTLHAWLTLQLRYLSFEGPATLIVKGCRGVRLEDASSGRTISQDATLGFSANARYRTVRAEPFIPYLRGTQPLLHDTFAGDGACYLYEEVPRNARPGRRRDNPLEVLLDAGLKAFGI